MRIKLGRLMIVFLTKTDMIHSRVVLRDKTQVQSYRIAHTRGNEQQTKMADNNAICPNNIELNEQKINTHTLLLIITVENMHELFQFCTRQLLL